LKSRVREINLYTYKLEAFNNVVTIYKKNMVFAFKISLTIKFIMPYEIIKFFYEKCDNEIKNSLIFSSSLDISKILWMCLIWLISSILVQQFSGYHFHFLIKVDYYLSLNHNVLLLNALNLIFYCVIVYLCIYNRLKETCFF
jgi:hypothetical protein